MLASLLLSCGLTHNERVRVEEDSRQLPWRSHRESLGLGLREAARRAELDPGYLSRIERGLRKPSLTTMVRLAAVLGMRDLARLLEPYLSSNHDA